MWKPKILFRDLGNFFLLLWFRVHNYELIHIGFTILRPVLTKLLAKINEFLVISGNFLWQFYLKWLIIFKIPLGDWNQGSLYFTLNVYSLILPLYCVWFNFWFQYQESFEIIFTENRLFWALSSQKTIFLEPNPSNNVWNALIFRKFSSNTWTLARNNKYCCFLIKRKKII